MTYELKDNGTFLEMLYKPAFKNQEAGKASLQAV
jgi:hypothetical protein